MKYLTLAILGVLLLSLLVLSTSTGCTSESCADRFSEIQRARAVNDPGWLNLAYDYCRDCSSDTSSCLQSYLY